MEGHFNTPEQLGLELFDYVHCYNNLRMHGTLGCVSPVSYRNTPLKNCLIYC
ncbi:IS3 family transposase [Paraliobacillus quinghaiensis]|uniref:IS3 family transposase n=1 Tax=Paraliobacillus quinghaiensis TaxID=470815 RepID=UPI000E3BBB95